VAGNEVYTLHAYVGDFIVKYGDVVLQLDQVEFIDSSGLGALVRLMQAARAKGEDLKLSGVPPKIRKALEMTNLLSHFETYDSVEEAITAAYLGSRYSRGKTGDARPRMLCVYESTDVGTFLREVLCNAGYNAMITASIDDARILLKATKAKLVVISARMQSIYGRPTMADRRARHWRRLIRPSLFSFWTRTLPPKTPERRRGSSSAASAAGWRPRVNHRSGWVLPHSYFRAP
jgi:anti-anti-sigma factor